MKNATARPSREAHSENSPAHDAAVLYLPPARALSAASSCRPAAKLLQRRKERVRTGAAHSKLDHPMHGVKLFRNGARLRGDPGESTLHRARMPVVNRLIIEHAESIGQSRHVAN
jgi:hypothetical protein